MLLLDEQMLLLDEQMLLLDETKKYIKQVCGHAVMQS